jgi:hypothetical protein
MKTTKKKVEPTAPKSGIMSNKSGQKPIKKSPLKKLTDLSGDGKVTQKDVLIGKGVIKSPMKQTVKDSCYKKVKASYKVFPSAYASGAIAKCRKNKSK